MNDFWAIHKKMLSLLAVTAVVATIAWFAVASTIYASIKKDKKLAVDRYDELKKYYISGISIGDAENLYAKALSESAEVRKELIEALAMRFKGYISIPSNQKKTKLIYFDTKLRQVRERLVREASINRVKIPQSLGWPDITEVPIKEQDVVVPILLKQVSLTDTLVSLLVSARVKEITNIKVADVFEESAGEIYPAFVRIYPIDVTFITELQSLMNFKKSIHYSTEKKRGVGQFLEIDYFDVSWNDDNPSKVLKVTMRLNALEFIEPTGEIKIREPVKTMPPGVPMGL